MHDLSVGDRLKYYRKMLGISQKELADNKVSSNLISLIERGRVPLSTVTASILVDNINRISIKKGVNLRLSIKDLMISDEEYIKKLCTDRLNGKRNIKEIEIIYNELNSLIDKFGDENIKMHLESSAACKFFELKEYEKAIKHYNKYLEYTDEMCVERLDLSVLYNFALSLYNIEDYSKSSEILNKINDILKDKECDCSIEKFDIAYLLACINYKNKSFEKVITNLKDGIKTLNNDDDIDYRVNRLVNKIGKNEDNALMNLYKDIKFSDKFSEIEKALEGEKLETLKINEEVGFNFKNIINKDYFLMFLILLENYINNNELDKAKAVINSARKNINNQ